MPADAEKPSGAEPGSGSGGFIYVAAAIAAVGGLLFGYDTGVISGAQLFLKEQFKLSDFAEEVIVSGALFGAVAGALSGGKFSDRWGRRRLLLITALIFAAGSILSGVAPSPAFLLAARVVVGLGIGLASTTVPVYISEVSPSHSRGWLVSLFQLAITVGIMGAYLVDYAFARSQGWRWMLGLAVVPAALLGLGMIFLPETPRWLLARGQLETARAVLRRIRPAALVEPEVREIQASLAQEREQGRWSDLFHPAVRRALLIGVGLAIFQQVTGINTVIYYAPTILQSAGFASNSVAILATAGIGVVNVLMTVVSMWLIDRMGRRPLLLIGVAGMAVALAVLGFGFHLTAWSGALRWVAVLSLMAYVASFAISLGPIFWLLIAEIYPQRIRGLAEGTAATVCWSANLLVSLTFLTLVRLLGSSWTFWTYGALAVAAWLFTFLLVPETKNRTLEEIECSWRTRAHEQPAGA
ncbi:MAG TPA: sugar porter family MFS transporter [Bacillota bacterium]|nr:sugar porter family MFS transporter [Bacillota bacterium]